MSLDKIQVSQASAHPRTPKKEVGTGVSFQFSPDGSGFARSKRSRDCEEVRRGRSHKRSPRLVGLRLLDPPEAEQRTILWVDTGLPHRHLAPATAHGLKEGNGIIQKITMHLKKRLLRCIKLPLDV